MELNSFLKKSPITGAILWNKVDLSEEEYDEYVELQRISHIDGWEDGTAGIVARITKEFFDCFGSLPKDAAILDIGCGQGHMLDVVRSFGYGNLYGIDINEEKIAVAKKKFDARVADMHEIPFADHFFDLVISSHVIEHCWYLDHALKEIARVTVSGALVWIIVPLEPTNKNKKGRLNAHTHPFCTVDQIREELETDDLKIFRMEERNDREPEVYVYLKRI
jgi:ubiquinone/menaquinone biosynthesis C-methylase UbiE